VIFTGKKGTRPRAGVKGTDRIRGAAG
jgi:hypothetical protein